MEGKQKPMGEWYEDWERLREEARSHEELFEALLGYLAHIINDEWGFWTPDGEEKELAPWRKRWQEITGGHIE